MIAYRIVRNDMWYIATGQGILRAACRMGEFVADSCVVAGGEKVEVGTIRIDYNKFHDSLGRFASGSGVPNEYARAYGQNVLAVKDFKNRRVARHHYGKHVKWSKEYPDNETYLNTAIALAEMPVGGDILGYKRSKRSFIRYNKATNDFVIAKTGAEGGIITLFKPRDKQAYYEFVKKGDGK